MSADTAEAGRAHATRTRSPLSDFATQAAHAVRGLLGSVIAVIFSRMLAWVLARASPKSSCMSVARSS